MTIKGEAMESLIAALPVEVVLPGKTLEGNDFVMPPCPMHGEGFICQHDADADYEDVSI